MVYFTHCDTNSLQYLLSFVAVFIKLQARRAGNNEKRSDPTQCAVLWRTSDIRRLVCCLFTKLWRKFAFQCLQNIKKSEMQIEIALIMVNIVLKVLNECWKNLSVKQCELSHIFTSMQIKMGRKKRLKAIWRAVLGTFFGKCHFKPPLRASNNFLHITQALSNNELCKW